MSTILTIFGTLIGAGAIYGFASGWFSLDKVKEAIHEFKQKENKEKVKKIEKEQDVLSSELENLSDINDDTRNEIKKIKKEAKKKILDTLNKDSIKEIDEGVDDKWDKI